MRSGRGQGVRAPTWIIFWNPSKWRGNQKTPTQKMVFFDLSGHRDLNPESHPPHGRMLASYTMPRNEAATCFFYVLP